MDIADAMIEKPHGFALGDRHFYIYPTTLGKTMLLKRHIDALGIDTEKLAVNPFLEALRVTEANKEQASRIIAYHTLKRKRDIFDNEKVQEIAEYINNEAEKEDIASLLLVVLTSDKTAQFIKHLRIDKEQDRLRQVQKVKKNKNEFSFGGQSVYGTLLDYACERYGWTHDYILWGISYTNLQLMMADKMQSVFLADEELKHVSPALLHSASERIKADDPRNKELIKQMDWR